MDYETIIGLRYLRSKRKEAFISFTTWISVVGIAIGVMAIIVVIAVMTGFQDEIRARILGINPHILVLDVNGEIRNPARSWQRSRRWTALWRPSLSRPFRRWPRTASSSPVSP
jgi:lipoprotein-releasing system permease protein